jgi:hypothetical protein
LPSESKEPGSTSNVNHLTLAGKKKKKKGGKTKKKK